MIGIVFLLTLSTEGLEQATTAPASEPVESRVALWKDFQEGMKPEEIVAVAAEVSGDKTIKVKRNKKGKFKEIQFYGDSMVVDIGGLKYSVYFDIQDERLKEINLRRSDCASDAEVRAKALMLPLKEKYGSSVQENVVDETGSQIETRYAFWNDETRVRVSFTTKQPQPDQPTYYANNGLGRALAALSSLAPSAYQMALQACPNSAGVSFETLINYSSQKKFEAEYQKAEMERKLRAEKTKNDL